MIPPRPANALPKIHTHIMVLFTSIPEDSARAGLSETARIEVPSLVR